MSTAAPDAFSCGRRKPLDPEERWDVVDELRLFSRMLGPREAAGPQPAPAVVLVHGFGMSSRYMQPLLRQLSARHRVYAPDLPGIGRSDARARLLAPPNEPGCSWDG